MTIYILHVFSMFPQTRNTLSRTLCCSLCLPVVLGLRMPAAIHSTPVS